jgi:hypothetical protein
MMDRFAVTLALALAALPSFAPAFELHEAEPPVADEDGWLAGHLETVRQAGAVDTGALRAVHPTVWVRGLDRRSDGLPVPPPMDKAMGASLRPFEDFDFLIGTELSRHEDNSRALRSALQWHFSWSRALPKVADLSFGFDAQGSVESLHGALSQSVSGFFSLPLDRHRLWQADLRLSPRMSFDSASHTWRPSLAPEFLYEAELGSGASPLTSLLKIRLGYEMAPNAKPSAAAMVELRFSPRS